MAEVKLSLVMSYYEAGLTLQEHQRIWAKYPPEILRRMEAVVVDDGSPTKPAEHFLIDTPMRMKVFRIDKDIPWNQDCGRNIGAKEAEGQWLLLTDMDLALLPSVARDLFELFSNKALSPQSYYMFARKNLVDNSSMKGHPNSYLISRKLYWIVGGYDESLRGHYGTDGVFKWQVNHFVPQKEPVQLSLPLYRMAGITPDCAVKTLKRKEGRDLKLLNRLRSESRDRFRDGIKPKTGTSKYRRIK